MTISEEIRNLMLAGIGSMALTYEKSMDMIQDLVEKGKMTIDEGKELSQELRRNLKTESSASKPITKEEMAELLRQMNFATKDDVEDLRQRISILEAKNQNV
ncbi:hypothetical protein HMPREF1982_00253 [Clostridiales bacterium oral taxon 876 str. F0540]|nr:hypothetical protein HMPREF1982_00253 [Clostridiales bacterium oral taxon 876 str. F0540]